MLTSRMDKRTQSANVACAVQNIYGNPDLHDHIFHLYAGPDYPPPPATYPPCLVPEPVELDPLQPGHRIDVAQLESICTHNSFGVLSLRPGGPRQNLQASRDNDDTPTGIYPFASLLNHSCAPNSYYRFIGNIMVVRASQEIKMGEEITLSYVSPHSPYSKRRETVESTWHMTEECDCRQCLDDRADGEDNFRRREAIIAALPNQLYSRPLSELRSLEQKLSATYATTRGPFRPALFFRSTSMPYRYEEASPEIEASHVQVRGASSGVAQAQNHSCGSSQLRHCTCIQKVHARGTNLPLVKGGRSGLRFACA